MKAFTDLDQSKKLAKILPAESADMCYIQNLPGGKYELCLGDITLSPGQSKIPVWSEEDEKLYKLSVENLTELMHRFGEEYGKVDDCINWLNSIKNKFQESK